MSLSLSAPGRKSARAGPPGPDPRVPRRIGATARAVKRLYTVGARLPLYIVNDSVGRQVPISPSRITVKFTHCPPVRLADTGYLPRSASSVRRSFQRPATGSGATTVALRPGLRRVSTAGNIDDGQREADV